MATKYEIERRLKELPIQHPVQDITIRHHQTGYALRLQPLYNHYVLAAYFVAPHHGKNSLMLITATDLKLYNPKIRDLPIQPSYQYLEIGAGLGGFIPHVVRSLSGKQAPLPIVIDPADYKLMQEMLLYAKKLELDRKREKRLDVLLRRCSVILNPKKVRLINSRLDEALQKHPDLRGIADIVVDSNGAMSYPISKPTAIDDIQSHREHIQNLEKELLKPEGIWVSDSTSFA